MECEEGKGRRAIAGFESGCRIHIWRWTQVKISTKRYFFLIGDDNPGPLSLMTFQAGVETESRGVVEVWESNALTLATRICSR
jgi:hypothetical protein